MSDRFDDLWQICNTIRNVAASEDGDMDRICIRYGTRSRQNAWEGSKEDDGKETYHHRKQRKNGQRMVISYIPRPTLFIRYFLEAPRKAQHDTKKQLVREGENADISHSSTDLSQRPN